MASRGITGNKHLLLLPVWSLENCPGATEKKNIPAEKRVGGIDTGARRQQPGLDKQVTADLGYVHTD